MANKHSEEVSQMRNDLSESLITPGYAKGQISNCRGFATRDGLMLRVLGTRSGALETPDWVSDRCFVYAYQLGSAEPLWISPIYQQLRIRADKVLDRWDKQGTQDYTFDPPESVYDQCNCFLELLDDSLNNEIGETPYIIAANHLTEVSGLEVKRLGTKDKAADDADGQTGTCLTVWPSKKGRRAKPFASRELRHWIKQELIAVPGNVCALQGRTMQCVHYPGQDEPTEAAQSQGKDKGTSTHHARETTRGGLPAESFRFLLKSMVSDAGVDAALTSVQRAGTDRNRQHDRAQSELAPGPNHIVGAQQSHQFMGYSSMCMVDFFEQMAGLLHPNFRLGYDAAGDLIDPTLARRAEELMLIPMGSIRRYN
ncbi:unnamed protein product [Symbiodinium microadriaticum]|nr:unnamed protein product [Symbiodinium microadriaticum]CAE7949867.1 unnamed protein product [Symbiodinium sp. KB8]